MTQETMEFGKDAARRDDPPTSKQAGKKQVSTRTTMQMQVVAAFKREGKMTDEQLTALPEFRQYVEGTVRKRRSELLAMGIVHAVGHTTNSHGSTVMVWDLDATTYAAAVASAQESGGSVNGF